MNRIFYVDGSCKGNPGSGGFGVVELNTCYSQTLTGYIERTTLVFCHREIVDYTTNNRMELSAILYVAQLAVNNPNDEYIIYSDSLYSVNIINEWMRGWAQNNWLNSKKKPAENLDLIQPLWKLFNTPFFNCQVKKIKGHNGTIGNELADRLAIGAIDEFNNLLNSNSIKPLNDEILLAISQKI